MRKFVYFFLAQIIEIISKIIPLKKNRIIFSSTSCNNFNFNSKYLFLYFLEKQANLDLLFVIDDKDIREKLINTYGCYFISSTSLSGLWKISRSSVWVSSVLETPYLPLYFLKNKKRNILHIGHGVPLKRIILAEEKIPFLKKINRYFRTRIFSHVTCYSDTFLEVMKDAFQNNSIEYIRLGQPRNDVLSSFSKYEQLRNIKNIYPDLPMYDATILYSPTWRPYGAVEFFPFDDLCAEELNEFLIKNKTILFLRQHPFYDAVIDESYLKQSHIKMFNSNDFSEIMDYLVFFDKLITDYSSIYLDFLCLNRPIAFIPYDLDRYSENVGFSINYQDTTPGKYLYTFI